MQVRLKSFSSTTTPGWLAEVVRCTKYILHGKRRRRRRGFPFALHCVTGGEKEREMSLSSSLSPTHAGGRGGKDIFGAVTYFCHQWLLLAPTVLLRGRRKRRKRSNCLSLLFRSRISFSSFPIFFWVVGEKFERGTDRGEILFVTSTSAMLFLHLAKKSFAKKPYVTAYALIDTLFIFSSILLYNLRTRCLLFSSSLPSLDPLAGFIHLSSSSSSSSLHPPPPQFAFCCKTDMPLSVGGPGLNHPGPHVPYNIPSEKGRHATKKN